MDNMMTASKIAIFNENVEEEAAVLEIFRVLRRTCPDEDAEQLQRWLREQIRTAATEQRLGFYLDVFGARDVVELDVDTGLQRLEQDEVWSEHSDVMLHVFPLD
jgi:hypothetical protein